jgi:hypothetical protein
MPLEFVSLQSAGEHAITARACRSRHGDQFPQFRNDDVKAVRAKKRIRRPPTLADLWSARPFSDFEFCGSNGSAFSFSSFFRKTVTGRRAKPLEVLFGCPG